MIATMRCECVDGMPGATISMAFWSQSVITSAEALDPGHINAMTTSTLRRLDGIARSSICSAINLYFDGQRMVRVAGSYR
jgi:hypothetical protein